jgi:dienelactone hydrolase
VLTENAPSRIRDREVRIEVDGVVLEGHLSIPQNASSIVLFVHGSGSGRHSPRNRFVAGVLQSAGIGTLLFDLLTREEEVLDIRTASLRFDIRLLSRRLLGVTDWILREPATRTLRVGYFGASTGAAAALVAAARLGESVGAVVSRGGRPDLAEAALGFVCNPTLLIVGGDDRSVLRLNETAMAELHCSEKKLVVIPGATHLFEEPGALEEVARIAALWFQHHLAASQSPDHKVGHNNRRTA